MPDYSFLAKPAKNISRIKFLVFLITLLPLSQLIFEFYTETLGIDPLARLTGKTGKTALVLLVLSLCITPLRHFLTILMCSIKANYGKRLADWNWIIKLRRLIGVMSFVYAMIHFAIYFRFDQGGDVENLIYDIREREFIAVGLLAIILLIPLFITSTNYMMRLLKKNWRRLHRTVYVIIVLSVLHYWMLSKAGVYDYLPYLFATVFLLGWRFWYYISCRNQKNIDDGMEALDRAQVRRIVANLNKLAENTYGAEDGPRVAVLLLGILSSEDHFSETILNMQIKKEFNKSHDSNLLVNRLKKERLLLGLGKTNVQAFIGLQETHSPVFIETVEKLDELLQAGLVAAQENDIEKLATVWTEIFSMLMPTGS